VTIEGESGLLAVLPRECVKNWNRSLGQLELWNDTLITTYSAEAPEALRGPQHGRAWCEELGSWADSAAWDNLQMGLRLGSHPQCVITTTPRPTPLFRRLMKTPGTILVRGSTFDNRDHLPEGTLNFLAERYGGTRLGRQELEGELLEDVPGALWTASMIDAHRLRAAPADLQRIVVSVDPSGTSGGGKGDDIGIIVAGKGGDGRFYVLEDASCNLSPDAWARRVVAMYEKWQADRVVAEKNFGGAMVEAVLRTASRNLPIRMVTASRGKIARAEPVAALYEQGKVSHCGSFNELEDELCAMTGAGYVGEGSPDRADALVWALSSLNGASSVYNIAALA